MTEAEMLTLLRERYTEKAGNGDAWAFIPHVRNAAGFDATRTIDAIAMALWPSRGLALHAIEIKVSRSDWVRELAMPAKAEGFAPLVDFFWLAVGDESIVQPGELPDGWGLLAPRKARRGLQLVAKIEARRLAPIEIPNGYDEMSYAERKRAFAGAIGPIDRSFVAAMLRSACRVAQVTPAEIEEAVDLAREQERQRAERELELAREELELIRALHRRIEDAAGVPISRWIDKGDQRAEELGRAVKLAMQGRKTTTAIENRLRAVQRQAAEIAEHAEQALERLGLEPAEAGSLF